MGHGGRERQLRGPLEADHEPEVVGVVTRRYRCRCKAVIAVVPRGVLRQRLYPASAIAMAMALWSFGRVPSRGVRERICPWKQVGADAVDRWVQLRRWVEAVRAGRLFPAVHLGDGGRRYHAERIAAVAIAHSPPQDRDRPAAVLAFVGGGAMA